MISMRSYCRADTALAAAAITAAALATENSVRSNSECKHASNTNSRSLAIAAGATAGVWVAVLFVLAVLIFPWKK